MIKGAGLGFRREMLAMQDELAARKPDFLEVAPENWIPFGGSLGKQFASIAEQYPFVCHGLSLSLGSFAPLDVEFVKSVKKFFQQHNILLYSEHLSYCSGEGHLYDLMPIPFTEEAVKHVSARIAQVQDIMEQTIAIENVSYYAAPDQQMSEIDFLTAILDEADCSLLLDVNNIYVNSVNHRYNGEDFLKALPSERIAYGHVAGHYNEADDLIVDTHGADVIDGVWELQKLAYEFHGVYPTLLERDFNLPPINELLDEVDKLRSTQTITDKQAQPMRDFFVHNRAPLAKEEV